MPFTNPATMQNRAEIVFMSLSNLKNGVHEANRTNRKVPALTPRDADIGDIGYARTMSGHPPNPKAVTIAKIHGLFIIPPYFSSFVFISKNLLKI